MVQWSNSVVFRQDCELWKMGAEHFNKAVTIDSPIRDYMKVREVMVLPPKDQPLVPRCSNRENMGEEMAERCDFEPQALKFYSMTDICSQIYKTSACFWDGKPKWQ